MPDIEQLIAAIDTAEASTIGGDSGGTGGGDITRERGLSIDYYMGRNVEPAPDGRSQVVDRTVFETIQWMLPPLCRIYASGEDVVEFVPFGPEDEQAAQQDGQYLNYQVTQRNNWFTIFHDWAHDALLLKNGYCMPYMDERVEIETEEYKNQSLDQAAALQMDNELVEATQVESDDPSVGPLFNLTVKRKNVDKKLRFQVLPPERCKVDEAHTDVSLRDCNYFEYADYTTISNLRQMGYDVADDISDSDEAVNAADTARDQFGNRAYRVNESHVDPSMRSVLLRMCWIRYDYDEDGVAELQRVMRVGSEVLKRKDGSYAIDQVTRIPVAVITPIINPHRHPGTSIADVTVDVQRQKTAVSRVGYDSLYQSVSPRFAVSDKVNLDDMSISAPGWNVRMLDGALPGEGHILPLVTPFVFPQAVEGLQYLDQLAENRSGASRGTTGVDPDVLSKSPSGVAVNQMSTMAAQRLEQVARTFAPGVEELFSIAHEALLKAGCKADIVKLRGKWVTVDPSTWKTGRDMRVVVGYAAGNKDMLMQRVMVILQAQQQAAQLGLPVVQPSNAYEALVELTKAADFTSPQRFWTDPSTIPPPPPQPSDTQVYAQIEAGKMASAERIKQAELAQKDRSDQLESETKLWLERMKQGGDINLESMRARMTNEPIEKKLEVDHQHTDMLNAIHQALHGLMQSITDMSAKHDMHTHATHQTMQTMMDTMRAPREVVRDKAGKVIGARIASALKH